MLATKKAPVNVAQPRGFQKELEHLYARRSAIDALIASLETYDRYRVKPMEDPKQKSA
jgi:hypothetical protein